MGNLLIKSHTYIRKSRDIGYNGNLLNKNHVKRGENVRGSAQAKKVFYTYKYLIINKL